MECSTWRNNLKAAVECNNIILKISCHGNDKVNTNIGSIVAAGDGEVDDVLVGGGKQGDKEEAEDKQDPPEAGTGSVPHFGTKFTKQA